MTTSVIRIFNLHRWTFHSSWFLKPLNMKTTRLTKINLHTSSKFYFPKIVPFILSDIGEGIVEVVVKEWYVKLGDNISQFDPLCEVQSDKASVTITSRYDGEVTKLYYQPEDIAKVGSPLLDISVADDESENLKSNKDEKKNQHNESEIAEIKQGIEQVLKNKTLATPAVRRIAKENMINIKDVVSTGKGGRVLKEDILNHMQRATDKTSTSEPTLFRKKKIDGIKKAMVNSMTTSWKIPHFTYSDEINVSNLTALKPTLDRMSQTTGVKITYMPVIIKAVSQALLKFEDLNACFDYEKLELNVFLKHNVGIAVDTPHGLIVPNIKNVNDKSVFEIAKDLKNLQVMAWENKLRPDDLSSGSFTLSNIGSIGGTYAVPIIMAPQVVIGAFGKIQKLPRFTTKEQIIAVDVLPVSWSADHRVVDGATIARFSNLFKLYLDNPKLILEL